MRITPNMTSDNALYNIQNARARIDRLNDQISSGRNIRRPSDDPITTRNLMELENVVKRSDQYMSNISKADIWLKVTDTALSGMKDTVDSIRKIVATLVGGTDNSSEGQRLRSGALSQLKEFQKQLVDMANTKLGDQYVLGGFKSSTVAIPGITDSVTGKVNNINVTNLSVGMTVSGDGLQAGTVISAIGQNDITTNPAPIADGSSQLTFGSPYSAAPFTIKEAAATLDGTTSISVTNLGGLSVGMPVTGPGILSGTIITAIDGTVTPKTVTLNQNATAPASGNPVNLMFGGNFRGTSDKIEVDITRTGRVEININGDAALKGTGPYGNIDILGTLANLITEIGNNNTAQVQALAKTFDGSTTQLNNARGDVASKLVRLESTKNLLTRDKNTMMGIISDRQNVDYAKAATEMSQQQIAFEAALSVTAKISQMSLLDYL